ncbi:PDZK1-interacting protein 1 [Candoia aspera]|uniref:PDZK1-interacting protein 1 n=1 Tax=Candoia aspera TaxID=51853 RepID=UPI002FD7FF63
MTNMNFFLAVTLCLLTALDPVNCQRVNRNLQPWLQGVIAVTVFLVLAVIAFIINRLWCQDKDNSKEEVKQVSFKAGETEESIISNSMEGRYSATAADFRCEEGPHVYENKVEFECDTMTKCHVENHVEVLTTNM